MKDIIIFFKQFYENIKNNFFMYSLFYICLSLGISSILFFYSNVLDQKKESIKNNSDSRTISIELNNITINEIKKIHNVFNCIENMKFYNTSINKDTLIYSEFFPSDYYILGKGITYKNINNFDNVAIVSGTYNFGDKFSLNKHEYKIVGRYDDGSQTNIIVLPYTTMIFNGIKIDLMLITIKDSDIQNDINNLVTYLKNSNIDYKKINAPDIDERIEEQLILERYLTIFIYILVLINCLYFYFYIFQKRKSDIAIYKLVGLSKLKCKIYILIENLMTFTLCFIFGIILCNFLFINCIINYLLKNSISFLSIKEVIYLYFYMLIFSLISMCVISTHYINQNIAYELQIREESL